MNDEKIHSLNSSDQVIGEILTELKYTREENRRLRAQLETNKPKVALADLLVSTRGAVTFQEASIFLTQHGIKKIGQNKLFALLRESGFLCSRKGKQWNHPTAEAVNRGYFSLQVSSDPSRVTVMITQKFLMRLLDDFTREQLPIVYAINNSKEDIK